MLTKRAWTLFALALVFMLLAAPFALAQSSSDSTGAYVGGGIGCCCGLILFGVEIYVIYWIYNDANSRGQNGVLWAILTFFFFVPALIVWFIIRPEKRS